METPHLSEAQHAQLSQALQQHQSRPGGLLPLLHALQAQWGYVPAACVPFVADAFNLSRAEVHGVLTYYPDFRDSPPGRQRVRVCQAESCQACGATALLQQCAHLLGCAPHTTSPDGRVTLDVVYCLGLCAQSPALEINGQLHARVTPERAAQLMQQEGL